MFFAKNFVLLAIAALFVLRASGLLHRLTGNRRLLFIFGLSSILGLYWLGISLYLVYIAKIAVDYWLLIRISDSTRARTYARIELVLFCTYQLLLVWMLRDWRGLGSNPVASPLLNIGLAFHVLFVIGYAAHRRSTASQKPSLQGFFNHIAVFTFPPLFLSGPLTPVERIDRELHEPKDNQLQGLVFLFALGLLKISLKEFFVDYHRWSMLESIVYSNVTFFFELSGYSDLACAFAGLLGVELNQNFNSPLEKTSVSSMWRNWHMSLTRWFEEHVYLPLQYSPSLKWMKAKTRHRFLIVLTFVIIGLWHDFTWGYLIWGACNGLLVVGESFWTRSRPMDTTSGFSWPRGLIGFSGWIYAWITTGLLRWLTLFETGSLNQLQISMGAMIQEPFIKPSVESTFFFVSAIGSVLLIGLIERIGKRQVSTEQVQHVPLTVRSLRFQYRDIWLFAFTTFAFWFFAISWFSENSGFSYGRF